MSAALVIYPDGDVIEIPLGEDSLKTKRTAIGCSLVDVVALTNRIDMWIDDEGIYNHPVNLPATALARHYGFTWQPYHGPVVLTSVDPDGNTLELTADQLRAQLVKLLDVAETPEGERDDRRETHRLVDRPGPERGAEPERTVRPVPIRAGRPSGRRQMEP